MNLASRYKSLSYYVTHNKLHLKIREIIKKKSDHQNQT